MIISPYRLAASLSARGMLKFLPDAVAVEWIYKGEMGKNIDLQHPETFNEKLQWLKLHDRMPLYVELVDKHAVRQYVKKWIGEQYLIPELAVWDTVNEIDYSVLPDQFVLKCTHDSGSTVVCRNKAELNQTAVNKKLAYRMKRSHYWAGREWAYKQVKPRIIAEKYMNDGNNKGLTDYKFYCFNGKPKFLYISTGLENHSTASISFFDLNGEFMPFHRADYRGFLDKPEMPSKFDEMKEIAANCAKQINSPFVRVDLYQIQNQVYFSEFTFCPCGGYMQFVPAEYDKIVGDMLKLPEV